MSRYIIKFNPFIITGLFVVLFNPPVLPFNTIHLIGLVSIVYILFHLKGRLAKTFLSYALFFLAILFYLLVNLIIIKGRAISDIVFPIYYLVDIIPFAVAIDYYNSKYCLSKCDLFNQFILSGLIQAILSLSAFLVKPIQIMFVNRIISYGGIESYGYWSKLRMYGFSNGLFFEMPVVQCILAIICLLLIENNFWFYLGSSVFLFVSAIINARTSLIVILIGLLLLLIRSDLKLINKLQSIFGIMIVIYIVFKLLFPFISRQSDQTYSWLLTGVEEINELVNGNVQGYFSYVFNPDRYVVPQDFLGYLFGEGVIIAGGNNSWGVFSDIGFINDIWFGGIVYVLFFYSFVLFRLIKCIASTDNYTHFIGVFLLLMMVLLNFKGHVFSYNGIFNITIILSIFMLKHDSKGELDD